ncbi:efflux RND transporter periplasmic adaptor subunit [Collimonas sp.]|jgi:macrolide-specific efflux system membrane fusion protein|uniref:efflux RND transporter periplasmic adaptor subunit n=1 Tax=Collimonas sp. TaxID=1963772 RepID=UPI002C0F9F7A|nr:efflux RND transporter periplasmic adaptor subunit [Collimonas sp.]HWW99721.1 efflux RND transporter periplasmic adaptor subunit [Collimonas sp.]
MRLLKKNPLAYIISVGLLLLLAFGLYHYFFSASKEPQYLTAPVTVGDIQDTVLANGSLEALQQVNVGAQVSGQLKSLKVALGQEVKKGQLVAEIDSLTQQNALQNAQAALNQVRAQLRSKQASLVQARSGFARQQRLLAGDAGSRENYETAEATLQSTLADIDSLNAQIEQAKITVSTAMLNLGYTKITAPMDGKVVSIVTKEGQTVNSAQLTPTIIILAELNTMTVKALVSEADVIRVKPQQPVFFTILGDPDHRFNGILRSVEPAPDSISSDGSDKSKTAATAAPVYYNALFDIPNPDNKLRISMTAQVSIVLNEAKGALTIPSTALGERGKDGRYQVRVLQTKDGKHTVAMRQVRIGINNIQAQVLDGLKAGEKVIVGDGGDKPAEEQAAMIMG